MYFCANLATEAIFKNLLVQLHRMIIIAELLTVVLTVMPYLL